jgi:aspartyl protease family protein
MLGCGNFSLSLVSLALCGASAFAADVTLVGLIGSRGIVVIDGGAPRTLAPGQKTAEGVLLLGTEKNAASFEIDGRKKVRQMGQAYAAAASGRPSVTLKADTRGHFVALRSINGGGVRFLVDTGATFVALPASDAKRLEIGYLRGERALAPVRRRRASCRFLSARRPNGCVWTRNSPIPRCTTRCARPC